MFAESAVGGAESGEEVGVDVEFTDNLAASEDWDDDFGFGFQRTGEIAGVGVDVVYDDGFAAGGGGAADALVERDASVRGHGAAEGSEDEDVASGFALDHVKTDPVVAGEMVVEERDDGLHESFGGWGGGGEGVELGDEVGGIGSGGGHGGSGDEMARRQKRRRVKWKMEECPNIVQQVRREEKKVSGRI